MWKARDTNLDERLKIVQDCLANNKNYGAMALKYEVSYQQVRNWMKRYETMGSVGLEGRRGRRLGTQPSRSELRDRIAQLEREKLDLQMENDLLKKVREGGDTYSDQASVRIRGYQGAFRRETLSC